MHTAPPTVRRLLAALIFAIAFSGVAHADRIWWDGTRDSENSAPGKLLSDNAGWWGESVLTGVQYRYENAPDSPADIWREDKSRFGRRLLDGVPMGDWYVPVGMGGDRPVVTIFDFQRACVFHEVDLITQDAGGQPVAVQSKIEVSDRDTGPWRVVWERSAAQSGSGAAKRLHRLALPAAIRSQAKGRYLRLTVQKPGGATFLNEVVVWGDSVSAVSLPEAIQPVSPTPILTGTAFASVAGIPKTAFADGQFREWKRAIGILGRRPALWSVVPTWDTITDKPLLPSAKQRASRVSLTVARNETESAALALTNTSMELPATGEVTLGAFERVGGGGGEKSRKIVGIRGEIHAAGAIGSRNFGVNIGPLLSADNKPGRSLLRRYLTNAATVEDFPRITLAPAGSAVLWLSVTTENTAPGVYRSALRYGKETVTVQVEVLDVTLPKPFVWVQTWSDTTGMFPFVFADRAAREVAYRQSLGVTAWYGFPTPGSLSALARQRGKTLHHVMALPGDLIVKGYNNQIRAADLTEKDAAAIAAHVRALVKEAQSLGLGYNDWYAELWDEPGRPNAALYGALARLVKKADPKVNLYCNPCFWEGSGVVDDAALHNALASWYGDTVNVSVPLSLLVRGDHPRMYPAFIAPRFINASYDVATQSAKSEHRDEIVRYRRMGWDAFGRGANGWGFYSYYAPRGDPWNDFDGAPNENTPDYLMVYPGPRGPVPTRPSESVREGWEDYRLLTLLKTRGLHAELAALQKAYAAGQSPETLRLRALRAAVTKPRDTAALSNRKYERVCQPK